MDFADQIQSLSQKIPEILDHVTNEAVTRSALVEPFIRILGYEPSNPLEVRPEFGANVDVPKVAQNKRVDYALMHSGEPFILIECKHHSALLNQGYPQLYTYYTPTAARLAILTNGVQYRLYADLEKPGIMDKTPFLEFDMTNVPPEVIQELKRLAKTTFDMDEAIAAAVQLKYVRGIKSILRKQFEEPEDKFVQYFFAQLCPGNHFAGSTKERFRTYAVRSFNELVDELIREKFNEFVSGATSSSNTTGMEEAVSTAAPETPEEKIVTTPEELQGFYIVKAILCDLVSANRVKMRDYQAYCNVLLDGKTNKPLCRFYFNNSKNLRIGLFDKGGKHSAEEKIPISSVEDIYLYYDRIKATLPFYIDAPVAL